MEQDNFTNVSWSEHVHDQTTRSASLGNEAHGVAENITDVANAAAAAASGAGPADDAEDAVGKGGGFGGETLQCTVGTPIKENDGTKDAFVSYLITTHVG